LIYPSHNTIRHNIGQQDNTTTLLFLLLSTLYHTTSSLSKHNKKEKKRKSLTNTLSHSKLKQYHLNLLYPQPYIMSEEAKTIFTPGETKILVSIMANLQGDLNVSEPNLFSVTRQLHTLPG